MNATRLLDAWLDTMRGADGYGGPIAHWWQQSLMHTAAGLDWRYEGIVAGYLSLWRRSGVEHWLDKAQRAGADLLAGQCPNGHFHHSGFEANPSTAGTPHEAACDIGLLRLAQALRDIDNPAWSRYAECARRNFQQFYIGQLWDETVRAFRDDMRQPSFVPNKAATAAEVCFLLADLEQDSGWIEQYALPNLDHILAHQVSANDKLHGGILQNSFGKRKIYKFFPIYIARCVPALLRGYQWQQNERFLQSAIDAMAFIKRWLQPNGTLPTVIYGNGEVNCQPNWVAPLGDVLYSAEILSSFQHFKFPSLLTRLLAGQDASGGIQTATGFAQQAGRPNSQRPDVRDLLHVVGWCDKAFRYLATVGDLPDPETPVELGIFETACTFRGKHMRFLESQTEIVITANQQVQYRWRKGAPQPDIATPAFWLR